MPKLKFKNPLQKRDGVLAGANMVPKIISGLAKSYDQALSCNIETRGRIEKRGMNPGDSELLWKADAGIRALERFRKLENRMIRFEKYLRRRGLHGICNE